MNNNTVGNPSDIDKFINFVIPNPEQQQGLLRGDIIGEVLRSKVEANRTLPVYYAAKANNFYKMFQAFHNKDSYLSSSPVDILLGVTTNCNLACPMCRESKVVDGDTTSDAITGKLQDYFASALYGRVVGGGEAMLSKLFLTYARAFASRECVVTATTNGTLLNNRMADELVDMKFNNIFISLDTIRKSTYEEIRIGAKLPYVIRNMRYLLNRRNNLGRTFPNITLSSLAMRKTANDFRYLLRMMKKLSLRRLNIVPLQWPMKEGYYEKYYIENAICYEERPKVEKTFAELDLMARDFGIALIYSLDALMNKSSFDTLAKPLVKGMKDIPTPIKEVENSYCAWPWGSLTVLPNGDVTPCCKSREVVGSLVQSSVEEVWNGEKLMSIREGISQGKFPMKACIACYYRNQPAKMGHYRSMFAQYCQSVSSA